MWDEIANPFPNFNGAAIEVWEWISNLISHYRTCDYLSMLGLMMIHVIKRGPWCHLTPQLTQEQTVNQNTIFNSRKLLKCQPFCWMFNVLTVTFSIQWTNITSSIYSVLLKNTKGRQWPASLTQTILCLLTTWLLAWCARASHCHSLQRKFLLLN